MIPFELIGFQIDVARQIERPEVLLSAIEGMHQHGYNAVMLYLEDAFRYERHPHIAREHAYSIEVMREVSALCRRQGMELIPCIPSLGHCGYITRKPGYERLDEGAGSEHHYDTVSPSIPETYTVLRDLYEDWCRHLPGRYLHVGLDESPAMGQHLLRTKGPDALDAAKLFATHCNRLNEIAGDLDRRMLMWGDMFYYFPEAIEQLDRDIIVCDWYYYAFDDTPRIEAFNFAPVDLSSHLVGFGNDVWGAPSVTVASPMPDIAERWQNLLDWVRYGKRAGATGLMNTDWENASGFYHANADVLFRAFGDNLLRKEPLPVAEALQHTLGQLAGTECPPRLADDLLAIGQYHIKGHQNRTMQRRPLETLANPARHGECRAAVDALNGLFDDLPQFERLVTTRRGELFCAGLRASHRQLTFTWRLGAEIPEVYEKLVARLDARDSDTGDIERQLDALRREARSCAAIYETHWNEVRYRTDRRPVLDWLLETAGRLDEWIDALKSRPPIEHPLVAIPRLHLELRCEHPALPVLRTTAILPGGGEETVRDIMIRFESTYARPDAAWTQHSVHLLPGDAPPERILCESTHYGQVGIARVDVRHRGKVTRYELESTEGRHVEQRDNAVWLGPQGATPEDPTRREDVDAAWFGVRD